MEDSSDDDRPAAALREQLRREEVADARRRLQHQQHPILIAKKHEIEIPIAADFTPPSDGSMTLGAPLLGRITASSWAVKLELDGVW